MWKLIPDGTLFFEGGFDLFDQFIISRGLLNGEQGLKMNLNEIKIDKSTKMSNHILAGNFEPTRQENKIHPIFKESPMPFEYIISLHLEKYCRIIIIYASKNRDL
jgi:hypothetical protein